MDNIKYVVRRDFLAPAALEGVSAELLAELKAVEKRLESDPCPKTLGCKAVSNDTFKIKIADAEEELTIIYQVQNDPPEIDLIEIRRSGWLQKAKIALRELMTFGPGK